MHKSMLAVALAALLLSSGCSLLGDDAESNKTADGQTSKDIPKPKEGTTPSDKPDPDTPVSSDGTSSGSGSSSKDGSTSSSGSSGSASGSSGTGLGSAVEETTDAEQQAEIKAKLNRMTTPSGYVLPVDEDNVVQGAVTLEQVAEMLRKKGFAEALAMDLADEFYKEDSSTVKLVPRDGRMGVFLLDEPATFTKKNKFTWTIVQRNTKDKLHGPHTSTYEVERLKDGTYRLNRWSAQQD